MSIEQDVAERQLFDRRGPRLSDGTHFKDMFDLEGREISLRVMRDPEIHALEMDRIFGRSWVLLAHESEIPNSGDFLVRHIGEDPVIIARGKDGKINLMLNVCAHRGMEVCFAEQGNTRMFKCPYHAWVYGLDGSLTGVPFEREMFAGELDKSTLGLPRVTGTMRHGLIFGNLAEAPVPFEEYLGDMLWYFDNIFEGTEWEAVSTGAARHVVHANWKTNLDQNHGDFLHTVGTHHDFTELGVFGQDFGQFTTKVCTPPNGHFIALFEPNFGGDEGPPEPGQTREILDERRNLPIEERGRAFLVFPATQGIAFSMPIEGGERLRVVNLAMHRPHGVDKFEFAGNSMLLMPKGTSPELVQMVKAFGTMQRGIAGGLFEDSETWRSITNAARAPRTRHATMKYLAVAEPVTPEGWPGPGTVYDGFSRDETQWHGWLHYYDLMTR